MIFCLLIPFILGNSIALKGQRSLKITFNVQDWEGNVPESGITVNFETDDKRENSKYGVKKFRYFHDGYDKNLGIVKIPPELFGDRSVKIMVDGHSDFYSRRYVLENVILSEDQVIDVKLERNWEAYHNRKTVQSIGFSEIPNWATDYGYMTKYMYGRYNFDVYDDDLDTTVNGVMEVIFKIDSSCFLVERNIIQEIEGMKSDLANVYVDAIEKRVRHERLNCTPMDSLSISVNWGWK